MDATRVFRWSAVGVLLQLGLAVAGHYLDPVARLYAPLATFLSFGLGFVFASREGRHYRAASAGGAVVGGVGALAGMYVAYLLGGVGALLVVYGSLAATVAGGLGGIAGPLLAENAEGNGANGGS